MLNDENEKKLIKKWLEKWPELIFQIHDSGHKIEITTQKEN
jgi:hypothetical protein